MVTIAWKGEPVKDELTGVITVGADITHTIACAVAGNARGRKIGSEDGKLVEYSKAVIMPLQSWTAPFGALVTLVMANGLTTTGTVKLMLNYQTHSQIWL